MSIQFHAPSSAAQRSNLTVNVSPLGLVEMADEEFEIHGPRLQRYAHFWAFYTGQHWSYRRPTGEQHVQFNYSRALIDYIISFVFGRGVKFRVPKQNEAIIPALLQRVWQNDNYQPTLLWDIGLMGGVSGDSFIKVAYEEPYVDQMGIVTAGKVRIIPLNSQHCYPEFHPHDKQRLRRMKIKYRFFGTSNEGTRVVHTYTEILTDDWIEEYVNDERIDRRPNPLGIIPVVHIPNAVVPGSPWGMSLLADITSLNQEFNEKAEDISDIINYHCVDGETEALTRDGWKRYDQIEDGDEILALDPATDRFRWQPASINVFDHDGPLVRWDNRVDAVTTSGHRWLAESRTGKREIVRTAEAQDGDRTAKDLPAHAKIVLGGGTPAHFPSEAKYDDEFVETLGWFITEGSVVTQPSGSRTGILSQSATANSEHTAQIRRLQAYWVDRGATFTEQRERASGVVCWYLGVEVTEALLSVAPDKSLPPSFLCALTYAQAKRLRDVLIDADGSRTPTGREVWYQDDQGRKDGFQMLSAMISGQRTRSFVNKRGDGVVDSYQTTAIDAKSTVSRATLVDNESGVVWCPTVVGGVWFARRNGVTYWTGNSAPTVIIAGARADSLERGANNMWSGLDKDAKVHTLELGTNLGAPIGYMELLKRAMHEMSGVPESALGQSLPISNTSGTAMQMSYMPLMNRRARMIAQYARGLQMVNKLVIRTLAIKEPWVFQFNQTTTADLDHGQLPVLDVRDPLVYETEVDFHDPLPMDKFLKMREIEAMMALGLESKRGAMQQLGSETPDEKLEEIFRETREDIQEEGALQMLRTHIEAAIMASYGMVAAAPHDGSNGTPARGTQDGEPPSGRGKGRPAGSGDLRDILGHHVANMMQDAYGPNLANRGNPEKLGAEPSP